MPCKITGKVLTCYKDIGITQRQAISQFQDHRASAFDCNASEAIKGKANDKRCAKI